MYVVRLNEFSLRNINLEIEGFVLSSLVSLISPVSNMEIVCVCVCGCVCGVCKCVRVFVCYNFCYQKFVFLKDDTKTYVKMNISIMRN